MNVKKRVTALIADDVVEMRVLLKKVLQGLECDVLDKVADGTAAIEKIDQLKPDIVFLDIDMPGVSGLQVLDNLKKKNSEVFRVIVSGQNTVENIKEAIARGANAFVVKPYSVSKIEQVIEKYHEQLDANG